MFNFLTGELGLLSPGPTTDISRAVRAINDWGEIAAFRGDPDPELPGWTMIYNAAGDIVAEWVTDREAAALNNFGQVLIDHWHVRYTPPALTSKD